LKRREENSRK